VIALVVSLRVKEDRLEPFLEAMRENAHRTFADEAGCQYFDVTQDREDPLHFIFYELYMDEAAVQAHRAAPHFADWRKAAAECVVAGSQVNTLCDLHFHHPPATSGLAREEPNDASTAPAEPLDHPDGGGGLRPR